MSDPIEETSSNSATTSPAQILLLAAGDHNLDMLRSNLHIQSPNIQEASTGYTPLHAAIASCTTSTPAEELANAEKVVRLLLENGAIWNTLDNNDETSGCIARRLGLTELYEVMVDAGVRAELLLSRLDGYEALGGDSDEDEEEEEEDVTNGEEAPELVERSKAAVEAKEVPQLLVTSENRDVNSADYLKSDLQVDNEKILDSDANGVMMSWETPIMTLTASLLLPSPGLRVLNIGFGMGIIDTLLATNTNKPASQHIVEAHPSIQPSLHAFAKTHDNITVHEGRWQDVLPKLVEEGVVFDAIYFDTFAEDYSQLRIFFEEFVVGLMDSKGIFSFFNGLGADRQICYDVYAKVVELDLYDAGLETTWTTMDIPPMEEEWKGVKRKYWALDQYRLPICKFVS